MRRSSIIERYSILAIRSSPILSFLRLPASWCSPLSWIHCITATPFASELPPNAPKGRGARGLAGHPKGNLVRIAGLIDQDFLQKLTRQRRFDASPLPSAIYRADHAQHQLPALERRSPRIEHDQGWHHLRLAGLTDRLLAESACLAGCVSHLEDSYLGTRAQPRHAASFINPRGGDAPKSVVEFTRAECLELFGSRPKATGAPATSAGPPASDRRIPRRS